MYTEILKIIEGGLNKDRNRVISYAKVLCENLIKDGEEKFARKIIDILEKKEVHPVYLDEFLSVPADQETRMGLVDIYLPKNKTCDLVLPKYVDDRINEFVLSVQNKDKLSRMGIDISSSMLLYGPPGCGKTSIAQYISNKIEKPLVIARLDSLISSLLGNTSKNIRKIFEFASGRPCILFLDEFDGIAKARDDKQELGELKRVINSLLQNIDEFSKNNILIAATNHHEMLDQAIWRRFSDTLEISKPDYDEIIIIVEKFLKNIEYDFMGNEKKINLLANSLIGLSPADIKTICLNAIKKTIIYGNGVLDYNQLVYEIYIFKNHSLKDIEKAVNFLSKYGVSQKSIHEILDISLRKVRSILNECIDE